MLRQSNLSRKHFLNISAGMLSAAAFPAVAAAHEPRCWATATPSPLPRSPLNDPTEQAEAKTYPLPLAPDQRLGYAIVGLGHLALDEVVPAFGACKYSKPVALVSGDVAKAAKVASQYGIDSKNIYDYTTFDRMADNKAIDAVYIILPNGMHHEFTIRAARAGKHVLCEKPMANSARECEEMIDACRKANRKLMVAYRIQYEPHNRTLMKWIRDKEYGNVKLLELFNGQHIGDPTQWRLNKKLAGGGSLPDVGIYCLNTCRFLLGEEPDAVFGNIYSTPSDARFKEVEESVAFQLHFPSGIIANCMTSYGVHMCRRYRAFTDKGTWLGMDPAYGYSGIKMELSQAKEKLEWRAQPSMMEKNQFALEMDHFSQCITENTLPYTPGEEGLQDMKIIEAIYRSAREGKMIALDKIEKNDAFRGNPPKEEA